MRMRPADLYTQQCGPPREGLALGGEVRKRGRARPCTPQQARPEEDSQSGPWPLTQIS